LFPAYVFRANRNRRELCSFISTACGDGMMSEDKPRATDRDRSPLLAGEDYEVRYLSEQTGLSPEQARILIRRYGNDREKLMQEAKVMRST
jgi:hypothetical protein